MKALKFSANLGFLWKELALPEAILAAKNNAFTAVECHWPYGSPATNISKVLSKTALSMRSINTVAGNTRIGEFGLCALQGRQNDARHTIDQALQYASLINCPFVHIMAGKAHGTKAHDVFIENLKYACEKAQPLNIELLIEPLNSLDAPEYFLNSVHQAESIISGVDADNIKLLFDCYHVEVIHTNAAALFDQYLPLIGHVQIASVPDRQAPNSGSLNYTKLFETIASSSYQGFVGAEYEPAGTTEDSLGWMRDYFALHGSA